MKYELIDCKPVPKRLAPELRELGFGDDVTLTSCLRTQGAVDFARSKGCSLSSQAELYEGWVNRRPGFNPANPTGRSTHECRNDGAAFPGWAGMPLRYWQVGIDCVLASGGSAVEIVRQRAAKRGWTFTLTYRDGREAHHGNFRREPRLKVFRPLRHGARGPRVGKMTGQLAYLGYLDRAQGRFTSEVGHALREFQRDWHLSDDGVYGIHTARQMGVAVRGKRKCRRKARADTKPHSPRRRGLFKRCGERWGKRRGDG